MNYLLVLYCGLLFLFCILGVHRLFSLIFWSYGHEPGLNNLPKVIDWPLITVQLPVYNEKFVIERLIDSVASLDYPHERLQIQVLDDSTDETTALARHGVLRLRERGIDAEMLHREDRKGFKAGALAAGLKRARGKYIAVFDADFLPTQDFLKRTVPLLQRGYGMVQARWGHINVNQSWFTQAQAILLDGHFVIQQPARFKSGRWFNFNGTAGIWRRNVIIAAGGWSSDTLTEDLDLSYRAQLAGHNFIYLDDLVQPGELPLTMEAFKAQQHRWAKGSIQTARKLIKEIWASDAEMKNKIEASFHLTANFSYLLTIILLLLLPIMHVIRNRFSWPALQVFEAVFFGLGFLSVIIFYFLSVYYSSTQNRVKRVLFIPLAIALGIGISVSQTHAAFEGLIQNGGIFDRTPKNCGFDMVGYRSCHRNFIVPEVLIGLYLLGTLGFIIGNEHFCYSLLLGPAGIGFLYVGLQSFLERRRGTYTLSEL